MEKFLFRFCFRVQLYTESFALFSCVARVFFVSSSFVCIDHLKRQPVLSLSAAHGYLCHSNKKSNMCYMTLPVKYYESVLCFLLPLSSSSHSLSRAISEHVYQCENASHWTWFVAFVVDGRFAWHWILMIDTIWCMSSVLIKIFMGLSEYSSERLNGNQCKSCTDSKSQRPWAAERTSFNFGHVFCIIVEWRDIFFAFKGVCMLMDQQDIVAQQHVTVFHNSNRRLISLPLFKVRRKYFFVIQTKLPNY